VGKLEASIRSILNKAGVAEQFIEPCMAWAFGADAWYIAPNEWVGRWNRLHPKEFRAKPDDNFIEFVFVVGTLFLLAKKKAEMKQ
jgi:hypothetical protein